MLARADHLSPKALAAWFVNHSDREAGEAITHLKVQKLAYFADAWFLANFDRPLIEEGFEAWAHGPVSPTIYKRYRGAGWAALEPERAHGIPGEVEPFLKAVFAEYGQFSAKRLEQITHNEDPWKRARGDLPPEGACSTLIDKLLTRNYYAARLGKKEIKALQN
jgi:uncharacterized phage-associated protein